MLSTAIIRPPAVAGIFYPANEIELRRDIHARLAHAQQYAISPCALLVPHAGFIYSADIAASAYKQLAASSFRRVLLLGPAHRVAFRGFALPTVAAFHTPLGDIKIDSAMRDLAAQLYGARLDDEPHQAEHSLEVQLPFLQIVLPQASVLPVVVGNVLPDEVVALINALWSDETLVVISSDLSHYSPYIMAQQHDAATLQRVLNFDASLSGEDACGCHALNAFLQVAQRRGLIAQALDLRNSGDTAGDKDHVVGYAAVAWRLPTHNLSTQSNSSSTTASTHTAPPIPPTAQAQMDNLGAALVQIARASVAASVGIELTINTPDLAQLTPQLTQNGATFVTLKRAGQLRGCIGSVVAHRPLIDDVRKNAVAAAQQDWRFTPLTREEWAGLNIEVSLLTPPEQFIVANEADACAHLVAHVDGVVLQCGSHRATFLPQVWDDLPNPRDFLAHLKVKAGLAADFWSPELTLQRYHVQKWSAPAEVEP